MLDYIILGMVLNDDLTGYDIKKCIETGIGIFYKASYGSLYPALKKLTAGEDLVMYEKPHGNRPKKYYHLTPTGRGRFLEWLKSPMNVLDGTNTHLAKIYFYDKLPSEIREHQLLEHEINNTAYLRKLLALEKELQAIEHKETFYYKLSTLYYGISITQATIRWCRHIRAGKPLTELLKEEE